jgi:hypothetical protein
MSDDFDFEPLPTDAFTEKDYKYGPFGPRTYGYPPSLGPDRMPCGDGIHTKEYAEVVTKLADLMDGFIGDYRPKKMDIVLRTSKHENVSLGNSLCFSAYFMQEFVPNGASNVLYHAATQKKLQDLKADVERYERTLAFAFILHPRLGGGRSLIDEVVRLVVGFL